MSNEFYQAHEEIRIFKASPSVSRESGIRLYKSSRDIWELQLRAPMRLGNSGYGKEGKDFIIAGASCSADSLRAIRNAIDVQLAEPSLGLQLAEIADALCDVECSLDLVVAIRKIAFALS